MRLNIQLNAIDSITYNPKSESSPNLNFYPKPKPNPNPNKVDKQQIVSLTFLGMVE